VVLYHGNVGGMSPPEDRQEASIILRRLSGQLRSTLWTVPWYRLFQILGLVEKREHVIAASTGLIGWSNSVVMRDSPRTSRHKAAVVKALDIPEA
jgi:hypothetical protein